jgi:LysR family glycine cleavage system transcriptional activator
MQAAKLGHGVALGDRVMEGDDLRFGNFVRPFDAEVPYGAYWLVAPSFAGLSPSAKAFADWIEAEFAAASPSRP